MKSGLMIFDLDGTILDSRASILESIFYALEELKLDHIPVDEKKAVMQDLRITLLEGAEQTSTNLTSETVEKFVEIYREHHSREPENKIKPFPGIIEALHICRENFDLAIATTKHSEQARHILSRVGLEHFFKRIQGTDSGLRYKPEPDILLKVLEDTKYAASRALYVGDSPHDLLAAHRAALPSVAAAYGYGSREHLVFEKPWLILDSVEDLRRLPESFLTKMTSRE